MAATRRSLLALAGAASLAGLGVRPASAQRTETVDVAALMQAGPLGDVVLGRPDAPVTLVEYASLTCGHCANFHTNILPGIRTKYVEPGRVKLVFREFPLNPLDTAASMLARCSLGEAANASGDQARYFALIETFFAQQRSWATSNNPLQALMAIARQAGFTQAAFEACLNRQPVLEGLNAVRDRAMREFSVNSTPTLFLNGRRIVGTPNPGELDRMIDALPAS